MLIQLNEINFDLFQTLPSTFFSFSGHVGLTVTSTGMGTKRKVYDGLDAGIIFTQEKKNAENRKRLAKVFLNQIYLACPIFS